MKSRLVPMQLRPLLEMPRWDGKLVLAAVFILGYYSLVWLLVLGTRDLTGVKADIVRDAMLTLGPPIGVIVGALFRTTAAEERRDAVRSADFQAALTAPGTGGGDLGDDVEKGARAGTRAGVEDAVSGAGAPHVGGGGGATPPVAGTPDPWDLRR